MGSQILVNQIRLTSNNPWYGILFTSKHYTEIAVEPRKYEHYRMVKMCLFYPEFVLTEVISIIKLL